MRKFLVKNERKNKDKTGKEEQKESNDKKTNDSNKNKTSNPSSKRANQANTNFKKVVEYILNENNTNEQGKAPNELLNIPKLKSKHKRLFKKLKALKDKTLVKDFSGSFIF